MSTLTNTIRVDLPLAELTDRRNCIVKECYLELHPAHVSYKCVADYEELDSEAGIWQPAKSNYRWTKLRNRLVNVEMWKVKKEGKYCVAMEFDGVIDKDGWYWEDPRDALVVYERLRKYMIEQ